MPDEGGAMNDLYYGLLDEVRHYLDVLDKARRMSKAIGPSFHLQELAEAEAELRKAVGSP